MKQIAIWAAVISFLAFVVIWGVMGVNIMNGEYDSVTVTCWAGMICLIVLLASILYLRFTSWKCPHCGRIRLVNGQYCYHCGKKIG
ncbi:MAG: hypothetical protein E7327_10735 [Clostridiales bacterium]|nr:hypothetical protein [Clostridiales bacterium]